MFASCLSYICSTREGPRIIEGLAQIDVSSSISLSTLFFLSIAVASCCTSPSVSLSLLSDLKASQLVASINFSMEPHQLPLFPAEAPHFPAAPDHCALLPPPPNSVYQVVPWLNGLEHYGFPADFITNSLLILVTQLFNFLPNSVIRMLALFSKIQC